MFAQGYLVTVELVIVGSAFASTNMPGKFSNLSLGFARRVELSMGWGSLQLRGQLPE